MWCSPCLGTLTNVTLVLNALVLVALTHGIMGALVLVATTASRDVGLVLWCAAALHGVLCFSAMCYCASALLMVVLEHTWCNWCLVPWCMTALFSRVSNLRGQPAWQSRWILRTSIESLSFCHFLSFLTFMSPMLGKNSFNSLLKHSLKWGTKFTFWWKFVRAWMKLARDGK